MSPGERVERLACYGFQPGETLRAQERQEIVEWTLRFEECCSSREELEAMSDTDLVSAAYFVMAEYAIGQM